MTSKGGIMVSLLNYFQQLDMLGMALTLPILRGVDAAKCSSTDGVSAANISTNNPGLLSVAIFSGKTTSEQFYRFRKTTEDAPDNEPTIMLLNYFT